jgi:hypothetical protein
LTNERLPNAVPKLVVLDGAPRHLVVFQGGESLIGHELELIDEIVARVMPEHPEVRRVLELESLKRFVR